MMKVQTDTISSITILLLFQKKNMAEIFVTLFKDQAWTPKLGLTGAVDSENVLLVTG